VLSLSLLAQKSPHGTSFRSNCDDCHKTDGWKVDLKTVTFDHKATKFPLVGQHNQVSCKDCHKSLEFAKTQTECNACHNDVHEQTVGNECARCHTPNSWVVTNVTQLHQQSRFPLIGAHTVADCKDCHKNLLPTDPSTGTASRLRFDPLGVECYDCHKGNYLATTAPNHIQGNYSTNCDECHKINSTSWSGGGINHNFFPLEGGHAISDCKTCHTSGSYSKIPSECISCHQPDFNAAKNPNHVALNFPTNCKACHSLSPGWKPADYANHDASFPIYSGNHKGEWNSCADCHTNPANYAQFSCTTCHEHSNKQEVDKDHSGVSGYSYNSTSCYACHPTGSKSGSFDHNKSGFPLTGAHIATACTDCHTSGYAGTSNVCASCHTNNYNQTSNPKHAANNISNDCALCHTTNPGWNPATFPTHNNYYVLAGAHVSKPCADCHKGNYTTTPNTCAGCHTNDFNQTTKPNHTTSLFPKTCETCHSQSTWVPSTFNHTSVYPLVGSHTTVACGNCHTTSYVNTPNTCAGCHTPDYNQTTNPSHTTALFPKTCETCHTPSAWTPATFNHNTVYPLTGAHATIAGNCNLCHANGYANTPKICSGCHLANYNQTTNPNHTISKFPATCETCHSNIAWVPSTFNHTSVYPLTGAHVTVTCTECHKNGYANTPTTCVGCHQPDFNTSANPSHTKIGISTDCKVCHTTDTGWQPALYPTHNSKYVIAGAHVSVACVTCHKGNYNSTPNTCAGCHTTDYNQTNNPNHASALFPKTCADCHSQSTWTPANWNHDAQYFPIYSGKHNGVWNTCADCHKTATNYKSFSCIDCHEHNSTDMNSKHRDVNGYTYTSVACYTCHPKGNN